MKLGALFVFAGSMFCSCATADSSVNSLLHDAILCKGDPADAVRSLVRSNENFKHGYAAYGFGEDTSYRVIAVLETPLKIGSASSYAVISESENSNYNFSAFTYARFNGDFHEVVSMLNLVENKQKDSSMGEFISNRSFCPQTIILTPMENGEFLLGCGWPNGC